MAEPIRYYMDQHYPIAVTEGLRRRDIDVLTAQEAKRCGMSDLEQLEFAKTKGRVIVSFDSDFLALHRSGISHAGIAWCPEQKYGIGMLTQLLNLLHAMGDSEQMRDHVEYL